VTLLLVHHADALGADVDPQRPLSSVGLAQADRLAQHARAKGVKPDVIWHSGKLRARQTAEILYRVCNPFAEFRMVRGLRPDDSPQEIRDAVRAETRDVLLVSHMPLLPTLAVVLAPSVSHFPLHGMVALERAAEGAEWALLWSYAPS
jgi:phosphohistidine phosphatase